MDLQQGEKVIYQGHPSWRAILGFYVVGIAVAAGIGFIVKLAESTGLGLLAAAVIIAITIFAGLVKRIATTYTITDRRLNIKQGIVSRKVRETRLQRVQNVNYQQGVYERVMQIGNVEFTTAGTEESNFVFAGVSEPDGVVEQVDRATRITTGLDGSAEAPPGPQAG